MARRSAIFALVSMGLLVTAIGLAYRHKALPGVVLGGVGFVLALVWFGSVLLGSEPANSSGPHRVGRQGMRDTLDRMGHGLSVKFGAFKAITGRRHTPQW